MASVGTKHKTELALLHGRQACRHGAAPAAHAALANALAANRVRTVTESRLLAATGSRDLRRWLAGVLAYERALTATMPDRSPRHVRILPIRGANSRRKAMLLQLRLRPVIWLHQQSSGADLMQRNVEGEKGRAGRRISVSLVVQRQGVSPGMLFRRSGRGVARHLGHSRR